jgi:hypothetical protein
VVKLAVNTFPRVSAVEKEAENAGVVPKEKERKKNSHARLNYHRPESI